MLAPTENLIAQKGKAALEVKMVFGESAVTSSFATSPLKLLTPRSRGKSVWAYTSSFGGGLVAGDQTQLDLRIGKDARCLVGTQASTKIYRNPALLPSGHVTRATLEENSLLVFAPGPVQAFANSTYTQRQEFHLASGSGLALVDWFTSGRAARGERWEFNKFQSRNDVFLDSERVFFDSLLLEQNDNALTSSHRLGRFNCVALLLLIGEPLREAAAKLLKDISAQPVTRCAPLISSASPIGDGAMLRVAGESVEEAGRELHRNLKSLVPFLGDDPWARKW